MIGCERIPHIHHAHASRAMGALTQMTRTKHDIRAAMSKGATQ